MVGRQVLFGSKLGGLEKSGRVAKLYKTLINARVAGSCPITSHVTPHALMTRR